ncbi:MAG: bifunctional adenosylcobinamide kinase/adenosylcobinamide-phosphate guanylyltransferase [Eubacteriales bacterium]|nr:bifunctional adenosylcobinamide kinase/adenosylcobinamide-phosphate guanylyltransferase [Eubacteriales bacterium]
MIFVTGPLYSGKREFARTVLGCREADMVWDVQDLAAGCGDLEELARKLENHPVVIATEVGGGVVPMDRDQRAAREAAGRLACLLAKRAETVVRVFCGLPTVLKGTLP